MDFQKIGFVGLGLIGGSLAKSIKDKYPHTEMIAMASRESTLALAYEDGIIRNNGFIPLSDFSDCDMIFLCSPVKINVEYLQKLKPMLSSDCIISDVGSVKGDISKAVADLQLGSQFIGGHPMAGSESTGYSNANKYDYVRIDYSSGGIKCNAFYSSGVDYTSNSILTVYYR